MSDIIIVGGGASGIMSAISAKMHTPSLDVLVLEKSSKALKKLLATGNGRCNLLNLDIKEENFHGTDNKKAFNLVKNIGTDFLYNLFEGFGLCLSKRFSPLVYPASFQASSVREALLTAAYDMGVKIFCDCEITNITPDDNGFVLESKKGKTYKCKKLILSGGTSATSGSDSCLALLKSLGHTINESYCALVPLTCKETDILKLTDGARAFATLTLLSDGKKLKSESGEVQFASYGLSGIVAMQLSGECIKLLKGGHNITILVSLFNDFDKIKNALLSDREKFKKISIYQRLCLMVNSLIADAILNMAKVSKDKPLCDLSESEAKRLAELMCDMPFTVTGSKGEKFSQVLGGGALLDEFSENLCSFKHKNLFATGEMLDVYGDCGGYNLTWAWASGYIAGKTAASDLGDIL